MADFSPTPWTADGPGGLPDSPRYRWAIADADGNTVALVSGRREVAPEFESIIEGFREAREAESDTNAYVLAAAPDLLDACEALLARFGNSTLDADQTAILAARLSIAKARGEIRL